MKKIALIGNPNTGKTSIFNRLTGLNQHIGNFPGVTVDKKTGLLKHGQESAFLMDFPGTYSIYPHSADEKIVYDVFSNSQHEDYPELVLLVIDASNLERNLLLFTQIHDLGLPIILIINMSDIAYRNGIKIDVKKLKEIFPAIQVCETNARIGLGMKELKQTIFDFAAPFSQQAAPAKIIENYQLASPNDKLAQQEETSLRFAFIQKIMPEFVIQESKKESKKLGFWDKITVHPVYGYLIFVFILMGIFQLIFSLAAIPMDLIDGAFVDFAIWTSNILPEGILTDLLTGGIIPGLGGVLVFLPQILLLFLCLGLLEETGYLARAVFIMDRLMRPFGLNGKSVVPLISSTACAIPGIMASRTIPNQKERLITILIAPLMSCSARIPVFTLLIALVVPPKFIFGFLNMQGLALFAMYILGVVSALFVAWILKKMIKSEEKSFFLQEIPEFKPPRWGNIFISLLEKAKIFVFDAGKIILAISILLWALASFGPGDKMEEAAKEVSSSKLNKDQKDQKIASAKLENSYIGIMGKTIEPLIKPLGFDWKIGISLISSFAAREVFVGSMATIYRVHQKDDQGLLETMKNEKNKFGKPVYSFATGMSLMVFFVYAMQCMATLAIVKRETKSWKWPLIQVAYMGTLAYLSSFMVYQLLA